MNTARLFLETAPTAGPSKWRSYPIAFALGYAVVCLAALFYMYAPVSYAVSRSAVWSPTGLMIGALLIRPRREWAHLLAIPFLLAVGYTHWMLQRSWVDAVFIIGFNAAQIGITAWALERFRRPITFQRTDDVFVLLAVTAGVNFLIGFAVAAFNAPPHALGVFLRNRWISHSLTNLILTPFVVAWAPGFSRSLEKRRHWPEFGLNLLLTFTICELAFRPRLPEPLVEAPYLALLPVIIGALRFGPRGASATMVVVSFYVIGALGSAGGWPQGNDVLGRVAVAELFLGVVAVTGLFLAASREERDASIERLRDGEQRLRGMFASSMNPIAVCRGDQILIVNPALLRLFGLGEAELIVGRSWADFILAADRAKVASRFARGSDEVSAGPLEVTGCRADGTTLPLELRFAPFRSDSEVLTIIGVRDLTESRDAARAIQRVNRVLRTISGANVALVRAASETELLRTLCEELTRSEGFVLAWAGMMRFDESKSVQRVASAGTATGYFDMLDPTWSSDVGAEHSDPSSRALRTGHAAVWRSSSDMRNHRWEIEAMRFGIASAAAFPLVSEGVADGVLCFYSTDDDAFPPDVTKLLQELADNTAYGISALRARLQQRIAEAEVRRLLDEAERARTTLLSILEDRQQAEQQRAATLERLELALRASRLGVWRLNVRTLAVEWDERTFEIFGLTPSPSAPSLEAVLAAVHPEDRERMRAWQSSAGEAGTKQTRYRIVRPDGSVRSLESYRTAISRERLAEWVIGVTADITEIVEATTESERLRQQLTQAQKMEALGTLAAGVAHDFNNLLTGINGFVDLAYRTVEPGHEAAELLNQAKQGAKSARDLVRQILNYSRSRESDAATVVDFVQVVRQTAQILLAAMPANVSVGVEIVAETAPVMADPTHLQQVLMNLAANAAQAIERADGRIEISVQICSLDTDAMATMAVQAAPGRYVALSVSDNGTGMDAATLKRIFEPFFTTKPKGEGTGLGLAIVNDIVRKYRAALRVTSTVGIGSRFEIFVPLASAPDSSAPTLALPAAAARQDHGKIMVVDDQPAVTLLIDAALKKMGYGVDTFNSPLVALRCFADSPGSYALVIADHNMPDMSGAELIARVRALAPELPTLHMSGGGSTPWTPPPGGAVLAKPFELSQLIEAVRAALERRPAAAQS